MIARDRELLARLMMFNTDLGRFTVDAFAEQDGGELPAERLQEIGRQLTQLGEDALSRAAELDGAVVEHVIVDAR